MSRIYFHEKTLGRAEIGGPERRYFGRIITDMFIASLSLDNDVRNHVLASEFPDWVKNKDTAALHLRTISGSANIKGCDSFVLALNTALAMGSPAVRLAAFIDGYCEANGWFHPDDFLWLKDAITQGLEIGMYRPEMGWESLLEFIEKSNGPIVMSYSVTNVFDETDWDNEFPALQIQRIDVNAMSLGHGMNGWQLIQKLKQG